MLNAVQRIWRTDDTETQTGGQELEPAEFTRYMDTPQEQRWTLIMTPFKTDKNKRKAIVRAIRQTPTNKAVGVNRIIAEALQVTPKLCSEIMCRLWEKCTEFEDIQTD